MHFWGQSVQKKKQTKIVIRSINNCSLILEVNNMVILLVATTSNIKTTKRFSNLNFQTWGDNFTLCVIVSNIYRLTEDPFRQFSQCSKTNFCRWLSPQTRDDSLCTSFVYKNKMKQLKGKKTSAKTYERSMSIKVNVG